MKQPSTQQQPQTFETSLFSDKEPPLQTPLLDADILAVSTMTLNILTPYRTIRILTYSTSPHILKQLFELAPDCQVECILGSTRTISGLADILAIQTQLQKDLLNTFLTFSNPTQEQIAKRIETKQLHFRVISKHQSHAKIFLLSDGPDGDRCALLGSANFSVNALVGDQHEVVLRIRNEFGWKTCEEEYLKARGVQLSIPSHHKRERHCLQKRGTASHPGGHPGIRRTTGTRPHRPAFSSNHQR